MEDTAVQPFPLFLAVLQADDGCSGGNAVVSGRILHPVFLPSLGGSSAAVLLVVAVAMAHQAHVLHPR